MNYSKEYKRALFEMHKEWLVIAYHVGKGLMLRQQMVALAVNFIGLDKVQAEVILTELNNAGLIKQLKVFANCRNLIVCYSKYLVAQLTGVDSKDSWVPKISTPNILYHIYKMELALEYLNRVGRKKFNKQIFMSSIFVQKNNSVAIYEWFDKKEGLKKDSNFSDDYKVAKVIKKPGKKGEKDEKKPKKIGIRSDYFNFTKFLANNFIVSGIHHEKEDKILELYYLKVSRIRMHVFYDLLKCMLRMFNRYFDDLYRTFNVINVTVVFFNNTEQDAFKRGWNRKHFKKHMGKEYSQLSEILRISYRSIDLDKKYHLSRDL